MFHKYIKSAKDQGRKFVHVPVVTNIVENYKQGKACICPRFAIEDALKRCIGKYLVGISVIFTLFKVSVRCYVQQEHSFTQQAL